MWSAIKGLFSSIFGFASSSQGGGIISQALDIAKERIVDVDKLVMLIKDVVVAQINAEANPSWVNALQNIKDAPPKVQNAVAWYIRGDTFHKLMRNILWIAVIGAYVWVSISTGKPMDLETLAALAAGPGLYTLLKGAGRK